MEDVDDFDVDDVLDWCADGMHHGADPAAAVTASTWCAGRKVSSAAVGEVGVAAHAVSSAPASAGEASVAAHVITTGSDAGESSVAAQEVSGTRDVYDVHASRTQKPLESILAWRGRQQRPFRNASICTGAAPEPRYERVVGVASESYFTCDNKASAYNFVKMNGPGSRRHHFVDLRELARDLTVNADGTVTLRGRCADHNMEVCVLVLTPGEIGNLKAGVSCKPFSIGRGGRVEGTKTHNDSDLSQCFIIIMKAVQPKSGILENVYGFALPESKSDKKPPLLRSMEHAEDVIPLYSLLVLVLAGSTWVCMSRRRLYVVFVHANNGGRVACNRSKCFLQDLVPCSYQAYFYRN